MVRRLRLAYCGTPVFAVPALDALVAAGHEIALVLTQPDRPVGRKQTITASAVKVRAQELGLALDQPEKIRHNEELRARLETIAPDAIVVVAYGKILPEWMLQLPPLGCINLHASLLPRHRGAAPIQWALAEGDAVTGNTTMKLDAGLDTGPILLQQSVPIDPQDTAVELFSRLAQVGAPLIVETLDGLAAGTIRPKEQDAGKATLARLLQREDGRMDFAAFTATQLWNRWRGFQPWPGAFTTWKGKKLIAHRVRPAHRAQVSTPGRVAVEDQRLLVACSSGTWLEILELQTEGRNRSSAADFLRGLDSPSEISFGDNASSSEIAASEI